MKRPLLIAWQLLTGSSDSIAGLLLIVAPASTLTIVKLHPLADSLPLLSYIGVFVLSVGIACLYGAWLAAQRGSPEKLEVVWLLTAITRGLVAIFIVVKVSSAALETGWSSVAITDGGISLLQILGLARGWLRHVRE